MIYPQEIEVWYVLPAIRREFAKSLVYQGLSQKEVSLKLGITEAAISQYLKDKRASEIELEPFIKKAIERAAKKIIKQGNIMKEIERISYLMKKNKNLCEIHHKYDKDLPKHCDICLYEK